MKNKTAIRELIEEMEVLLTLPYINPKNALNDCINLAFAKLAKEKEQITNAHQFAHFAHGNGLIIPSEDEFKEAAEEYYKDTFEQ